MAIDMELTEPEGRHFDPLFKPDLSPKETLAWSIGGVYAGTARRNFRHRAGFEREVFDR